MTKLTTKTRKSLPKSDFALPGSRKYPVNDKAHAANAKARAQQQYDKGAISKSTLAKVDAKANKVLGDGKPKNPAMANAIKAAKKRKSPSKPKIGY